MPQKAENPKSVMFCWEVSYKKLGPTRRAFHVPTEQASHKPTILSWFAPEALAWQEAAITNDVWRGAHDHQACHSKHPRQEQKLVILMKREKNAQHLGHLYQISNECVQTVSAKLLELLEAPTLSSLPKRQWMSSCRIGGATNSPSS